MIKAKKIALALLFSCSGLLISSKVSAADDGLVKLGVRINRFAFSMFRELSREPGNVFFSPYSVSTALTMTGMGARGETASEMSAVLKLNVRNDLAHELCGRLIESLDSSEPDHPYKLLTANRIWAQSGLSFNADFIAGSKRYYGAGLQELDFASHPDRSRRTINKWVEDKTGNMIRNLLSPSSITRATRLVLTNAVYFKGAWRMAFEHNKTRRQVFFTASGDHKKVPLMHAEFTVGYMKGDFYQAVELPYKGDDISMLVILPSKDKGVSALEGELSISFIKRCVSRLSKTEVDIFLPRFKTSWSGELKKTLACLGMSTAFSGAADFSGISDSAELNISKVIHKAVVDVNEEGTEAAAATAVIMDECICVQKKEPPLFRADHPFVFLIRHRPTGTILFMGRIDDPTKS